MARISLFIIGTIFFTVISRKALKNPGAHGFYRFFVFEGLLLLILLNQPHWLQQPNSLQAVLSWGLLLCSLFFIVYSLLLLKKLGGHGSRKEMPENFTFENTVNLVEVGIYQHVRHPMYSSLLLLGWGAFLKHITIVTIPLILMVSGFLIAAAKVEEQENLLFFGNTYREYMERTKMFIPKLF